MPAILHTPLMSGANAIHGVVIIGAIIVLGHAETTGSNNTWISCCSPWYSECCRRICRYRQDAGNV